MSPPSVHDRFSGGLSPHWLQTTSGAGFVGHGSSSLLLGNSEATDQVYTNAQIDDYQGLPRADFLWRPPLRLTVRARFSHNSGQLTGTAGFGFWNEPVRMRGFRRLALPQALWFFYAGPDADMRLALDKPGWGWKAAVIDTRTRRFQAMAPFLAATAPLMRVPLLYRWLWRSGQRAAGIAERLVPAAMQDWHIYCIDWGRERVGFFLDGRMLLEASHAPAGPLGLVIWLDNQFLQVAPWGLFRWGLVGKDEAQWLEIDWLAAESGAGME
ncbi:MAG: hypothetical protein OXC27_12325 [Caldilineaceae bacterium]|nr:hypothetical protein [Caldilineaceae bacterium]